MDSNERDILAELESIMNNANADYDRERHEEHIKALTSMADFVDRDHDGGDGVYLLAMMIRDAEEMQQNGAVTVDGYVPSKEEIERDNLTGVKVQEIHFFDDYKQVLHIMSDPEGMVLMYEHAEPIGYLLIRPNKERALVLIDGVAVDNKTEPAWSKDYDELDPNDIRAKYGEFGKAITQTVTALQMPAMLKKHKPRMYQAMLDDMKERLEKNDETDN